MDSKVKRLAILAALSVMILIGLTVVLVDRMEKGLLGGGAAEADDLLGEAPQTLIYQNGQIGSDLSAFMNDSTFFDPDDSDYLDKVSALNHLSLIVTSVEKDLRIQVVNAQNQPVSGESFFVTLKGVGDYKDLDKDGIIYIADLDAGDYEVVLHPVEGYRIPADPTRVRVKEKVEYIVIDDISLLIRTEADIDAQAEDAVQEIGDADQTEMEGKQTQAGSFFGIDVSKWQGEIDWDKVRDAGVQFAIIRCGYRGMVSGTLVEDPYFERNIKGASAAGIKVGVYFFTQAVNEVEAVEEASAVISLIRDHELQYPVFIDTESAGGEGRADDLDPETRTLICEAFCRTIENEGQKAGVYASRNWFNKRLEAGKLERYSVWLAEYRSVPLYQGYYQMWQYSSKGSVDGIDGRVDLDISYADY